MLAATARRSRVRLSATKIPVLSGFLQSRPAQNCAEKSTDLYASLEAGGFILARNPAELRRNRPVHHQAGGSGRVDRSTWCGRWDSNPHEPGSGDFKSPASTIPPRPHWCLPYGGAAGVSTPACGTGPLRLAHLVRVEARAHFLARLEIRDTLPRHVNRFARARVAAFAGIADPG